MQLSRSIWTFTCSPLQDGLFGRDLPLSQMPTLLGSAGVVGEVMHDDMFPTVACFSLRAQAMSITSLPLRIQVFAVHHERAVFAYGIRK